MPGRYRPAEDALPTPPWLTVHLSNRELSLLVPIDFVTRAGASLSLACFSDGIYDEGKAERCISNLLAARFRRLHIDIFWDANARRFSLCPFAFDNQASATHTSSSANPTRSRQTRLDTTSANSSTRSIGTASSVGLQKRQGDATSSITDPSSPSVAVETKSSRATTSASRDEEGEHTPQGGPYNCTSSMDLAFLASLMNDYIEDTSNILFADPVYLIFNLHAAFSSARPDEPSVAPSEDDMPKVEELLGNVFKKEADESPYQPSDLLSQRENLNQTWDGKSKAEGQRSEYFTTVSSPAGLVHTPNGWPDEETLVRDLLNRYLLGWGTIDSQMKSYNFRGDGNIVFPPNYINRSGPVSIDKSGQVDKGCFYDSKETTVQARNSSWEVTSVNGTTPNPNALTSCGISPLLNATLNNRTADIDPLPYVRFVQATVWNWDQGEPRNASQSNDQDKTKDQLRCALLTTSSNRNSSRWRAEHCPLRHRAACRVNNTPFNWRLSDTPVSFLDAEKACKTKGWTFSVPHTSLENRYLHEHILSLSATTQTDLSSSPDAGIWLNFNSLDVEGCWVTSGAEGRCPYFENEGAVGQRTVLVPVIASLVVILLAALTLFVKCNKNRRNSRKRVRGEGGWDYEGVPS